MSLLATPISRISFGANGSNRPKAADIIENAEIRKKCFKKGLAKGKIFIRYFKFSLNPCLFGGVGGLKFSSTPSILISVSSPKHKHAFYIKVIACCYW